jgi:hypothetical protein
MPALTSLVNPASAVVTNTDANPASVTLASTDTTMQEIAYYLGKLVKMSEALAVVDIAQRQRVVIENATWANNLPVAVRNSNNVILGDLGGSTQTSYSPVPEFWKFVEAARQNYQTSIRSNLQFS